MTESEYNTYLEATIDYFRGGFTMVDEDAPDGAYIQMHIDIAEDLFAAIEKDCGLKPPKGLDGLDVFHYYLEHAPYIERSA